MTSHRQQCSVTLAAIRSCAITCIFCKQQWRTQASMDCAPNGGISLLVTGSVTFQNGLRNLVTPSSSPQLNDGFSSRPPAATGIRSHPHQSSTDLMAQDFSLTSYHHHSARGSCYRNERLHRLRRRQGSAQGISNRAATEENDRGAFIWVVAQIDSGEGRLPACRAGQLVRHS